MSLPSEITVEFVAHLRELVAHTISTIRHERLLGNLVTLESDLQSLHERMLGVAEGDVLIFSEADLALLINSLYYTSQEYLCGIDESTWHGAVPPSFELPEDTQFLVRRGPGGYGAALQTFHVRGSRYLHDSVKVNKRTLTSFYTFSSFNSTGIFETSCF